MSIIVRTHTFVDGTVARPDELNTNENTLYTEINGSLDWDNLSAALINAANGLVKLNASGDVPLAQIPDVLTGKDADKWDGIDLGDTINIDTGKELQHNSTKVVGDGPKVFHSVYN